MPTTNITQVRRLVTRGVLAHYATDAESARPIDRRDARNRLHGLAQAADAVDVANTPDHFKLAIITAVRAAGPRPGFRAVGNSAQQNYDFEVVTAVMADLGYVEED